MTLRSNWLLRFLAVTVISIASPCAAGRARITFLPVRFLAGRTVASVARFTKSRALNFMPTIRTVLGDIDSALLGRTNAHEHLFIRDGLIVLLEPEFRLDSEAHAISEATDFRSHGGQAIIDTSPLSVGRDPEGLVNVSRATGLH